jgi:hypothetical protein
MKNAKNKSKLGNFMKKALFLSIIIALISSCSTYRVSSEIDKKSVYSKFRKSGIIIRLSKNTSIHEKNFTNTLSYWMNGLKKRNDLLVISEVTPGLSRFESSLDRFYQLSNNKDFQKYKSDGVVLTITKKNSFELNKIMTDNGLDSVIFYEVDGGAYGEMQFVDFDSMIVIVDKNLDIAYMDHQKNSFEIDEFMEAEATKHLLDKISERFVTQMVSIGFLDKR